MVFSSLTFLFLYLPLTLLVYFLSPLRWRNFVLLVVSLLFYGWGEPVYIVIMFLSIIIDYTHGLLVEKFRSDDKKARWFVAQSVIFNLALLGFFKYWDFIAANLSLIPGIDLPQLGIPLPIGISFYTFQTMSYTIDVYRKDAPVQRNMVDFGAFVTMFPQLIAGPIVQYKTVAADLRHRLHTSENFALGARRFCVGLAKKVLLANSIGALWEDCLAAQGAGTLTVLGGWLGLAAYGFQIYFDFSGYSDMAIGLGRIFGFRFNENFDHPYCADSVGTFWRRWHMSLTSWFRDYLYIPLGGNRKGRIRTIVNLGIVWLLTGFWHGAAWNFILWGVFIFLLEILEKNLLLPVLNHKSIAAHIFSHIYMILYILVSWTIFAISDFNQLAMYLARMFPFFGMGHTLNPYDFVKYLTDYGVLLICCILFCTAGPEKLYHRFKNKLGGIVIALIIFWYSVYYLAIGMNNPFLYFRF